MGEKGGGRAFYHGWVGQAAELRGVGPVAMVMIGYIPIQVLG